jgi:hypothetical protein
MPHTVAVFALLGAIFLFGYLEGAVFKQRDWACATWILGLVGLAVWIVYPGTVIRIGVGALVLISGVILMTIYYKRGLPRS